MWWFCDSIQHQFRRAQQAVFVIEETTLIENLSLPERIGPSYKWKGVIYPKVACATEGEVGIVLFWMYFFYIGTEHVEFKSYSWWKYK